MGNSVEISNQRGKGRCFVGCFRQKHNKNIAVLVTKNRCIIALCPKESCHARAQAMRDIVDPAFGDLVDALDLAWDGEEGSGRQSHNRTQPAASAAEHAARFWLADSTSLIASTGWRRSRCSPPISCAPPLKWRPGRLIGLRAARAGGDEAEITLMTDDGAPYTYVKTKAFPSHFDSDTMRNLPDIEALQDAGLLSKEKLLPGNFLPLASTAPVNDDDMA